MMSLRWSRLLNSLGVVILLVALCGCSTVDTKPVESDNSVVEESLYHIPETDHGLFSEMTTTPEIGNIVSYMDSIHGWFVKKYPKWSNTDWYDNGGYVTTGMQYESDEESFSVSLSVTYEDLEPGKQIVVLRFRFPDRYNLENEIVSRVDEYLGIEFDIESVNTALKSNDVVVLEYDNTYMGIRKSSDADEYYVEVYMCDSSVEFQSMRDNAGNI